MNERQKQVLLAKMVDALGPDLTGRTVAVWGLAFKAETDDMRESPSIPLIEGLLAPEPGSRPTTRKAMETRTRSSATGLCTPPTRTRPPMAPRRW